MNQLQFKCLVDLVAQIADVDIHHVAGKLFFLVVKVLPDIGAADHLPGAKRQVVQQGVFAGGERDGIATAADRFAQRVDLQIADVKESAGLAVRAANQRSHPRQQLIPVEGFDEVIIRAQVQSFDAILRRIARCQAEHRRTIAPLADFLQHRPAFLAGQHDVQHHAVVFIAGEQMLGLKPIEGEIDGIALFAQPVGNRARQLRMIFGD